MSFLETRFPTDISLNSQGGPRWRTIVTTTQNGWEQRLQKWEDIRAEYDVSYGVRTTTDLTNLIEFFNEMRGQAYAFRYKDWLDYSVTDEPLTVSGGTTVQLIKTYGTGFNDYTRDIKKPVSGTVTMKRNAASFTDFSIDTTTGIITFTASLATLSITDITQHATQATVTSTSHGRSVGDKILFDVSSGMTEIDGEVGEVTAIVDPNSFEIDIDTSAYTAWSGTHSGDVYIENGDTFTWSGEYDIPVRFAQDELDVTLQTGTLGSTGVSLIEVRL